MKSFFDIFKKRDMQTMNNVDHTNAVQPTVAQPSAPVSGTEQQQTITHPSQPTTGSPAVNTGDSDQHKKTEQSISELKELLRQTMDRVTKQDIILKDQQDFQEKSLDVFSNLNKTLQSSAKVNEQQMREPVAQVAQAQEPVQIPDAPATTQNTIPNPALQK